MIHNEFALSLLRRVAPRGDPVPAQDAADRLRVGFLDLGDVQSQLESRPPPRHPGHLVAEDLPGQLLPVRRRRDRDPRVRMQMIDMRRIHQPVHRRVDARRRPTLAMQAVVERRHHLVLPLHPGIHAHQRLQPIQPQRGEPLGLQRPEVAPGPLHPQQLDGLTRHRIGLSPLGGRVPPGIVRVLGVRPQAVRPSDQLSNSRVGHQLSPRVKAHAAIRSVGTVRVRRLAGAEGTRSTSGLPPPALPLGVDTPAQRRGISGGGEGTWMGLAGAPELAEVRMVVPNHPQRSRADPATTAT